MRLVIVSEVAVAMTLGLVVACSSGTPFIKPYGTVRGTLIRGEHTPNTFEIMAIGVGTSDLEAVFLAQEAACLAMIQSRSVADVTRVPRDAPAWKLAVTTYSAMAEFHRTALSSETGESGAGVRVELRVVLDAAGLFQWFDGHAIQPQTQPTAMTQTQPLK